MVSFELGKEIENDVFFVLSYIYIDIISNGSNQVVKATVVN